MFNITSKAPVLFGEGTIKEIGPKAKEFGWKKVICIYDPGVKAAGIVDQALDSLREAGIAYVEYDKVVPDPPDYAIEEAADIARNAEVDGVIAVGGGSPMDLAKCVNILLTNLSPINQYIGFNPRLNPVKGVILVPTTAGTGSEVSIVAVITDTKLNAKVGVAGEACVGKLAIIDPALTYGLPARITAQTGIDAFTHGLEAFTSVLANPYSDMMAEKCMRLVVENLPIALNEPQNTKARENLSYAAMLGGMAFTDALTHLGHCIGQSIGAVKHLPHGVCCSLGDGIMIEYLADAIPEKTKIVGEILGVEIAEDTSDIEIGRKVAAGFAAFCSSVGIPTRLSEAGVVESDLNLIAKLIAAEPMLQMASPKKLDETQALGLLKKAL